uniref:DDE-1 domain-containing protein n=1 Tax=Amphimedon queenslandica TaxID=400682 RepID=A0A1X7T022_AMPQE
MGYSKRKCSNAGNVSVYRLKELQGDFLADIQAEVLMNNIPPAMIFNWDQTGLQLVPTGRWTMNQSGEKMIPIAHSDNKRQVTAVLAASLTGEFLPPLIIYQGKTTRCHPTVTAVPQGWDLWHRENH